MTSRFDTPVYVRRITEHKPHQRPMLKCGHAANATCSSKGGIRYDPPVPSCAICSCIEATDKFFTLEGRRAQCCSADKDRDSSTELAFFEYRGPGSKRSIEACGNCGYYKIAHENKPKMTERGRSNSRVCDSFVSHGAYEFDRYYCGCKGWD